MPVPTLDHAFLTQAAETLQFRLGLPVVLAIAPDGNVLFRRTPARSFASDLYELDVSTGAVWTLASAESLLCGEPEQLSDAEQARRERTRTATRGILYAELSRDGTTVLIPLGERVFLLDRASARARELAVGVGFPFDPRLSPDGQWVAFVRGGDLWMIDAIAPEAAPRRLTERGDRESIEYGCAEFAAQEELARTRGFWWAPDSRSVLFQRTDNSPVDTLYVADARHPDKPPVPFKYPRAGTGNAIVDLGVVSIDGGEPRWITWDLVRWPYLAQVNWPARGALTVLVLDREQYEFALLAVDPTSAEIRTLVCERDAAWVNVPPAVPTWLADGSGFLWLSEARGAWTLEHHDASGRHLGSLTAPEFGLRELLALSADGRSAWVTASSDAREAHLWKLTLDDGRATQWTEEPGVHTGLVRHGTLVVTSALASGGTRARVHTARGQMFELPSAAERPLLQASTELLTVSVGDHQQHVAITRPRSFDSARCYPVLLKAYGGPHHQMITNVQDNYAMDQWYADAGFIVVRTDGRGTPSRGRDWERATLRDLISIPLADQVSALRAVGARYRELDLERVGVFGWSFGGYFSAMAVLQYPELFKAAVAGAPVTDWALYDTAYTERYMKTPANNIEGYRSTSLLTHAARLSRPLLLIHGVNDDNVHFAHTLALLEALYVAGKRAEVIALSGTHMVPNPTLNLAREQAHIEFFRQHLMSG
jgi:dipeptidyl-peptidase 4